MKMDYLKRKIAKIAIFAVLFNIGFQFIFGNINYVSANGIPPVVTLIGSGILNLEKGINYTELGAEWSDTVDGTGVVSTISGTVNSNSTGIYTLDYIKVNSLGLTGSISRTVNIIDTTSPAIPSILSTGSITKESSIYITGTGDINEFVNIYNSGVIVGTGIINSSGSFNISITLNEGLNTITAKSYDISGNYSANSNSINVVKDSIFPIINSKEIENITETGATLKFGYIEEHISNPSGKINVKIGTTNYNISFSGGTGTSIFTGLTRDSNYIYTIHIEDDAGNATSATGSFSTLKGLTGSIDYCPAGDKSGNLYDLICGKAKGETGTGIILDKPNINKNYIFMDLGSSFAKSYVEILQNKGVIKVYSGRLFIPNKKITRAEFLVLVMKAFEINLTSTGTNSFTDITKNGEWLIPYLIKAKELGIINGQTEKGKLSFKPEQPISRIEAIAILFRIANLNTSSSNILDFTDRDFQDWMLPYAKKAKQLKITDGQTENGKLKFKPNSNITRAEASKFIVKFLDTIK